MGIQFKLDIKNIDGKRYISMDSVLEVLEGIKYKELTEEEINRHFEEGERRESARRANHNTMCANEALDAAISTLTNGGFSY